MATHGIIAPRTPGITSGRGSFNLRHAWAVACVMLQARRTRRMLREMDSRMLSDIGLGRGDAQVEAARPFWDIAAR